MDKKRDVFIDMVKGVAIFFMLWGHCIQYCVAKSNIDFFENNVFKFIYSFHMPLFMLVSGYLFFYSFSKRNLKELLIHKTQSLIQPIIFCSIFNYMVTTVLFGILSGDFFLSFNGQWMENISSLWFLWSVLSASLVVSVVCKKCNNFYYQIILLIAAVPLIAFFPNSEMNLYMYPYFVVGFYFAKYKDRIPTFIYNIKYLSVLVFPILLCFYEKRHYIYTSGLFPSETHSLSQILLIDVYRWLIGFVGSIFTITLLQIFYKQIALKFSKPILSTALCKMGEKSLQIYAFSVPFLSVYLSKLFPKALSVLNISNIFVKNMFVYNFVFTTILSLIYAFVLYYIIKLFDKIKITKILFGK